MKILQVVHGFPPKGRAGTEIYTYNLSKELSRNHEVHVFFPSRKPGIAGYSLNKYYSEGLHIAEIVYHQLPFPRAMTLLSPKCMYKNIKAEKAFEAILDEMSPDVVHFQHLIGLSASLISLCKNKGIPTVLTLHDFWFMCHRIHLLRDEGFMCSGPNEEDYSCLDCYINSMLDAVSRHIGSLGNHLKNSLTNIVLKRVFVLFHGGDIFLQRNAYLKSLIQEVDVVITPSDFLQRRFVEYGLPEEKVTVSNHGMDTEQFNGFIKKKSERIRFGFVAPWIEHYKGAHVLVEAFNKIKDEHAELRVYGNYDPRSPYYRALRVNSNNPNVRFMGRFEDVKEPYSEMDVLVVPSICYESYSLVVQEAFITRTPVIASDIGALPEFVQHNKTGLLFKAGSSDDLYEKIKVVLENQSLISKFKANIKSVKTIQEQARELEGIYENLRL
ncbi:MAG: glycosyltransferase family 4 protein [Desulfobacteraceae bacterium]|nr:glycosyltransferase family 4 protein [Desulfobacteraceae bacterium]